MRIKKEEIRRLIRQEIKRYSLDELNSMSEDILSTIEEQPSFIQTQHILLFHSLTDEVNTHKFIEKWKRLKHIYLPVVKGDDLEIVLYGDKSSLKTGKFGILEPHGIKIKNLSILELAIIPGVAFDIKGNRLGRGRGYYDRLLPKLSCIKLGICFPFQILETIPTEEHDIRLDGII